MSSLFVRMDKVPQGPELPSKRTSLTVPKPNRISRSVSTPVKASSHTVLGEDAASPSRCTAIGLSTGMRCKRLVKNTSNPLTAIGSNVSTPLLCPQHAAIISETNSHVFVNGKLVDLSSTLTLSRLFELFHVVAHWHTPRVHPSSSQQTDKGTFNG